MPKKTSLIGKTFGRLKVIGEGKKVQTATVHRKSLCLCECGNKVEVFNSNLTRPGEKSCGCLQRERRRQRNEASYNMFLRRYSGED